MRIELIKNSELSINTYLLVSNRKCLIIDAGLEVSEIDSYLYKNRLTVVGIILTHGHFDHIANCDYLINKYHCSLYIHKEDAELLKDSTLNCSMLYNNTNTVTNSDYKILFEGNYNIGGFKFNVLHVPGHTKGSVVFYFPQLSAIFTGDFLFKGTVGRTDLPTSDDEVMKKSLKKFLLHFSNDVVIYPGHGDKTSLSLERKSNPFLFN